MIETMKLDLVLRVAWAMGLIPLLIPFLPSCFPILDPFKRTVLTFLGRGKIAKSTQSGKFSVPQSFFAHFYIVALIWTTFLLVVTWDFAYNETAHDHIMASSELSSATLERRSHHIQIHILWRTVWLLLMMEFQSLRRLYETLFVFKYGKTATMHIACYLGALCYYIGVPLTLSAPCLPQVLDQFVMHQAKSYTGRGENQVLGFKMEWLIGYMKPLLRLGWWQYGGLIIYLVGMVHQYRCHVILGSLRARKEDEEDYKVPQGDWFDLVSCAHYLAEIVIYLGILVSSEGSNATIWLLVGVVVANLTLIAKETHQWYQYKFDNYPKSRCAILPFVL